MSPPNYYYNYKSLLQDIFTAKKPHADLLINIIYNQLDQSVVPTGLQ